MTKMVLSLSSTAYRGEEKGGEEPNATFKAVTVDRKKPDSTYYLVY